MTRDEIIELLRSNFSIPPNKALSLLSDYCYERGKNPKDINRLLNALVIKPSFILSHYVTIALAWYKVKYNINTILDSKTGKIIHIY